jgi:hypothetical protein
MLAAVGAAAEANVAVASYPQLSTILPRGVQRGGERELTLQGARL